MPGGRLTRHDREEIAAGLARNLTYTEIAERIGRPPSTVSREVHRNGGYARYEPDRAQTATGERARRRRPTRPPAEPAEALAYGRDTTAVIDFEEQLAAMMAQTGLPRMAARVLVGLLSSDAGSLTAAELVERLRISPASISKAVGYLESLELVRRERGPGRRERYVFDESIWYHASETQAQVCAQWSQASRRGADVLGVDTPAGARLDHMSRFFEFVGRDILAAAERWRREFPQ
ncbi:GbsR/MarR family transcriptional regulator [Pseudonocardia sp. TRM90224]|uniref:GbsR/MarR family transcriptional regulator n=1 Tax=Pseudonocardia sp. TRM90224 TaxID=2812678 RepID=UPI001E5E0268|nr:MarR family transcriptional regulator [Pseudonocardia sp. TRM90224]